MERKRVREGHLLSEEVKVRTWKEREPATQRVRGALTSCRGQKLGQVRTQKGREPARDAYQLQRSGVGTSENIERRQASEGTYFLERVEVRTGEKTE